MRFSRTLASIVLAFSFALGSSVGALAVPSTPDTTSPAEASPDATVANCITINQAVDAVFSTVSDAQIKMVSKEPPYIIVFTADSRPTDFVIEFDINGCLSSAYEVSKVKA